MTDEEKQIIVNENTGHEFSVEEIAHSNRIQKSVTPKLTLDWYIKWASSIIVLSAISIRSTGLPELQIYDMFLSWLGAVGWFIVSFMWKDRALILLNGVMAIMLASGIIKYIFN